MTTPTSEETPTPPPSSGPRLWRGGGAHRYYEPGLLGWLARPGSQLVVFVGGGFVYGVAVLLLLAAKLYFWLVSP